MKLTDDQKRILTCLSLASMTTATIQSNFIFSNTTGYASFDQIHSSLTRLLKRGYVKKISVNPNTWELTDEGRVALEAVGA